MMQRIFLKMYKTKNIIFFLCGAKVLGEITHMTTDIIACEKKLYKKAKAVFKGKYFLTLLKNSFSSNKHSIWLRKEFDVKHLSFSKHNKINQEMFKKQLHFLDLSVNTKAKICFHHILCIIFHIYT